MSPAGPHVCRKCRPASTCAGSAGQPPRVPEVSEANHDGRRRPPQAVQYTALLAEERRRARQRAESADAEPAADAAGRAGPGKVRPGAGSRGGAMPTSRPDWVNGSIRALRRVMKHK
jgi:hypothetical protein